MRNKRISPGCLELGTGVTETCAAAELIAQLLFSSRLQKLGKIELQDSSGGNFDNLIHMEFSDTIPFCTTLALNIPLNKILKFSTTAVLKHDFTLFKQAWFCCRVYLELSGRSRCSTEHGEGMSERVGHFEKRYGSLLSRHVGFMVGWGRTALLTLQKERKNNRIMSRLKKHANQLSHNSWLCFRGLRKQSCVTLNHYLCTDFCTFAACVFVCKSERESVCS